ncbi:MAG: hypothetical protein F4Y45_13225 [Acidobacteria bacterium]|nr:hypothetical protein [Acidobacteriota bacterium]MYJ04682.1 hypothetical protein [Acidobacteriota bacterium]
MWPTASVDDDAMPVDTLMAHAAPDVCFLHCLPAHRGEEVADRVMDSPASVAFDQAEKRLHTQEVLRVMLFEGQVLDAGSPLPLQ